MGSYNPQYENYYNGLANRKRSNGAYAYKNNTAKKGIFTSRNFVIRIIRELVCTLLLFMFVIVCKTVNTPQTKAAYDYSKNAIKTDYDYMIIVNYVKGININSLQDNITNWIDIAKNKITGTKTIDDKIKTEFITPLSGKVIVPYGESTDAATKTKVNNLGIDLSAAEGSDVKSSFDGNIKECGEDSKLGKYILIDHGEGIETKYCNLKEVSVKKDQKVKKGDVIGKSGTIGAAKTPALHFELLYMGENKNPEDYFKFS